MRKLLFLFLFVLCRLVMELTPVWSQERNDSRVEFIRGVQPFDILPKEGANALCIDGDILYCGAGNKIYAVDVREPLSPKPLSSVELYGKVRQMTVKDGVLFLATRQNGVECVDVSNPARPVHIRMEKTPESQSVTYRDGVLYSGEWLKGMPVWDEGNRLGLTYRMKKQISLLDIADVEAPKLLWREETSGYPETGIFWCGKLVVPCGYQGLLIEK